jgi:hypothetical protein
VATAVGIVRVARLFTIQSLSQPYSGHPLSDSGLAVEEVGVGQTPIAHTRLEQGDGVFVAYDISERHVS